MPRIATAVAALEFLVKAIDPARAGDVFRLRQFAKEQIALGVYVGRNAMRDFLGVAAELHADIAGRGADPDRPSVVRLVGTPEANVIAFARAVADRLFKGEIFLAAEEEEIAHGRARVGFVENGIDDDALIAAQAERISVAPAGGAHGTDDICFAADERDIQRIAWDAIPGVGEARAVDEIRMAFGLLFPDLRQDAVGDEQVNRDHAQGDPCPTRDPARFEMSQCQTWS